MTMQTCIIRRVRSTNLTVLKKLWSTNELIVVYITGDEAMGETTEPLKKELTQQIRNKEMRRDYCLTTVFSRRELDEDYMLAWLKQ